MIPFHRSIAQPVEADPVSSQYVYRTGENREGPLVAVVRDGETLFIRDLTADQQIGAIVFGSTRSGSIWKGTVCLGEYEQIGGRYFVRPYEDGARKSPEKVAVHPLDYLLRVL